MMKPAIKSTWMRGDIAPIKPTSNGKAMTRRQKINCIEFQREQRAFNAERAAIIAQERARIAAERSQRASRLLGFKAMIDAPETIFRIKQKNDGGYYMQGRKNGKFLPTISLVS